MVSQMANVKCPSINFMKYTCSIGDSRLKDITHSLLYKMSPKPLIPDKYVQ